MPDLLLRRRCARRWPREGQSVESEAAQGQDAPRRSLEHLSAGIRAPGW